MPLLPEDEEYLRGQGFEYNVSQWNDQMVVVITGYGLPPIYSERKVDLLVMIPPGYPIAKMDMFWVYPDIRLLRTNSYPVAADYMQEILGKVWQRFSRHYDWRPGVDSLAHHLGTVKNVLYSAT